MKRKSSLEIKPSEEVPLLTVIYSENREILSSDNSNVQVVSSYSPQSPGPSSRSGSSEITESVTSIYESLPREDISPGRLNTELLLAIKCSNILQVRRLLECGASPNATCHTEFISACHLAALHDNDILSTLIRHGADRNRADRQGRTPLHFAAWAGSLQPLLALLAFPEELQIQLQNGEVTTETEENIVKFSNSNKYLRDIVNIKCHLEDKEIAIPKAMRDNTDHSCKEIYLPHLEPGWTALHAASSTARPHCCRILLAAGADPNLLDEDNRTPFNVAGSYYLHENIPKEYTTGNHHFIEVIKIFLTSLVNTRCFKKNVMMDSPLHTAVAMEYLEAIDLMLHSGASITQMNRAGLTPLHLCIDKKLKRLLEAILRFVTRRYSKTNILDSPDKNGYSALHYAVLNQWPAGVSICLDEGANVNYSACNGETPLHTAAALGNQDILEDILKYVTTNTIDVLDDFGESALFKAILASETRSVNILLQAGASIKITMPGKLNVFHVAAKLGNMDILKMLLDHDNTFTQDAVNATHDQKGFGPIHFAVENNHIDCVRILLSKKASISLKTSIGKMRPMHIAARKNNVEITELILKTDESTIHDVDALGYTPLHTACLGASKDVIRFLISKGADLSARTAGLKKDQKTAIDIMMENLMKPTEFLSSIFDTSIYKRTNTPLELEEDMDAEVVVDYSILLPNCGNKRYQLQSKVIKALIKSGNEFGQKQLLLHPLVETFLCIKWKAILPFYYVMLCLYGIYLITLTIFIMTHFGYYDSEKKIIYNSSGVIKWDNFPAIWDTSIWSCILYIAILLIIIQELIFISARVVHFIRNLHTWITLLILALAAAVPTLIGIMKTDNTGSEHWEMLEDFTRYIATAAIILSWILMGSFLSMLPQWGIYVVIFDQFFGHMLKILFTFSFLVVGYALIFMIQFYHKEPFDTFWYALIKTVIMTVSDFDSNLISSADFSEMSLSAIRIFYLIQMIFTSIILINIMTGVAASDFQDIDIKCHIMRLKIQISCLASFDSFIVNKVLLKLLPEKRQKAIECKEIIFSKPASRSNKCVPQEVRDAIFKLAFRDNENQETSFESVGRQLKEIHKAVNKWDVSNKCQEKVPLSEYINNVNAVVPHKLIYLDVVNITERINNLSAKIDLLNFNIMIKQEAQSCMEDIKNKRASNLF